MSDVALAVVSFGGLAAGLLLLRRVPVLRVTPSVPPSDVEVSVIIPARNEELSLPALLGSLPIHGMAPAKVLLVDDASTDGTAAVAERFGATVISSAALPEGWTGKAWACHQGAMAATTEVLFFLDADTRFVEGGYEKVIALFQTLPQEAALSLLPFHRMTHGYEQLSLFFNILMAMGAGGFGGMDAPHLFGQSLLVRRSTYWRAGGHRAVRGQILENLHLAACLKSAGAVLYAFGGRGVLETRMFPQGLGQLHESWRKAFAAGAGTVSPQILALSVYWLSAATLTCSLLLFAGGPLRVSAAFAYLLFAAQIGWYGAQLGTFRWAMALVYPAPLAFYFAVFGQSAWLRMAGRRVTWKGRRI